MIFHHISAAVRAPLVCRIRERILVFPVWQERAARLKKGRSGRGSLVGHETVRACACNAVRGQHLHGRLGGQLEDLKWISSGLLASWRRRPKCGLLPLLSHIAQYSSHQPVALRTGTHKGWNMFRPHFALAYNSDRRMQLVIDHLDLPCCLQQPIGCLSCYITRQ